jgi:hypothetical protein
MSHFYGVVQGNRGDATRGGSKQSGLKAIAASWAGAIEVELEHDTVSGDDRYIISQRPWHGRGTSQRIAVGTLGELLRRPLED